MSNNQHDSAAELAEARRQLAAAQARVALLEAQAGETEGTPLSQNSYIYILDNLLEGAEIIGFDWRYLYVNDTVAGHGRQSKDVLLRSTVIELYPGIEQTPMFKVLRRCMEDRTPQHFETEFVFPDGGRSWFELRVQPVPEGIFILSLDITERKLTEDALQESHDTLELRIRERTAELLESEEKFRRLLDAAPMAAIIADSTGRITLINIQAEQLFGYTRFELSGQPVDKLIPEVAHDQDTQHVFSFLAAPSKRQMHAASEWTARHKDGREFPVEIESTYLEIGAKGLVMAFIVDVTERREQEKQLRYHASLQENVSDAVIVTDTGFHIQSWNRAAERIYGWSVDEVLNIPVGKILRTEFASPADLARNREQLHEQGWWQGEVVQHHKDGSNRHILSSITVVGDDYDRPVSIVCVNHDITERKQAEESLRRALAKEKELGELKSRFVSMASHEFRTPLASILSAADTLDKYRQRMSEEATHLKLRRIMTQVKHLTNVMDDLLDLGRLQSGHIELKPVDLDLDALCQTIIDDFRSQPEIRHEIHYKCHHTPMFVRVDERLMQQVINNLIANAVKYSPAEKPIFVNLKRGDVTAVLQVQDKGIGIPSADLNHLFEPFHRAANVGTISGTGLGLSITKQAVELQGGSIVVESTEGQGTTFIVTMPVVVGDEVRNG